MVEKRSLSGEERVFSRLQGRRWRREENIKVQMPNVKAQGAFAQNPFRSLKRIMDHSRVCFNPAGILE
jgi:hypothetical protein